MPLHVSCSGLTSHGCALDLFVEMPPRLLVCTLLIESVAISFKYYCYNLCREAETFTYVCLLRTALLLTHLVGY
jgi:hypothetical protein